jgi:hypothetical protein
MTKRQAVMLYAEITGEPDLLRCVERALNVDLDTDENELLHDADTVQKMTDEAYEQGREDERIWNER